MTYLEIDKAISDIAEEKCTEAQLRLESIAKENVTERKAVMLEHAMYEFCRNAGLLSSPKREENLKARRSYLNRVIHKYTHLNEIYQNLNEEDKLGLVAALQAEIFIRDQWLGGQYKQLSAAMASNDAANTFELKIKIGAVENIFSAWEAWRRENGIYPNMLGKV